MSKAGASALDFFTNEPVEGELLADRLARETLASDEALRLAIEIGSLLHRAHSNGSIHRRVSPYTVMITPGGARLLHPNFPASEPRTAPYRSPEQVRGEMPDWRSDVFAYGALLYEIVGGRRAFTGEGEVLDRQILTHTPAVLQSKLPVFAAMEGVIASCLEKEPARRRQRIQNAVIELKLAGRWLPRAGTARTGGKEPESTFPLPGRPAPQPVLTRGFPWRWIVAGGLMLAAAGVAAALWLRHPTSAPTLKFAVSPPDRTSFPATPAISPDGHYLTFSARGADGRTMLWLRRLDALHASELAGTEDGFAPFWSPDSHFLAFFAGGSLKKLRLQGGQLQTICPVTGSAGGGAWNGDGTILYSSGRERPLYRVAASGGTPRPVTRIDSSRGERAHLWPEFLPDGRHFLFFALSDREEASGVYAGDLESGDARRLLTSDANAVYAEAGSSHSGYLLFLHGRNLMAQQFQAAKLELRDRPAVVAEDIGWIRSLGLAPVSASRTGVLAYETVGPATRQLVWFDRDGNRSAEATEPGEYGPPRISPDGSHAVFARATPDGQNADLHVIDTTGKTRTLTPAGYRSDSPVWSPDGSRVVFSTNMHGGNDIDVAWLSGGQPALLLKTPFPKYPTDWSRDWRYILFGGIFEATHSDIYALSIPDRHFLPVLETVHSEGYATFSADRKWLAYQSDESGRFEVYVQPFHPGGGDAQEAVRISDGGGGLPRWRFDGQELYYMTSDGRINASTIRAGKATVTAEPPHVLFQQPAIPGTWNSYDAAPDGQRFLLNVPLEWSSAAPITVLSNWSEALLRSPESSGQPDRAPRPAAPKPSF